MSFAPYSYISLASAASRIALYWQSSKAVSESPLYLELSWNGSPYQGRTFPTLNCRWNRRWRHKKVICQECSGRRALRLGGKVDDSCRNSLAGTLAAFFHTRLEPPVDKSDKVIATSERNWLRPLKATLREIAWSSRVYALFALPCGWLADSGDTIRIFLGNTTLVLRRPARETMNVAALPRGG